jgi:5-methyltetrahydropteroyltriglutamate--homocysteine methyltransferase
LLAAIYARELQELKSAGASLVQIDEPLIALNPQDFADFQAAVKTMAAGQNRPEILLGLYFADAAPLVDKLALLPVEGILFDFTYSKNLEAALTGFPKNLGLGLIDGRNTKIENVDELRKKADKTMASLKSQKLYITTSSGLEYLPRDRAFDKLKLTADFARALKGGK